MLDFVLKGLRLSEKRCASPTVRYRRDLLVHATTFGSSLESTIFVFMSYVNGKTLRLIWISDNVDVLYEVEQALVASVTDMLHDNTKLGWTQRAHQ
jgi:hypothetical protein